MHAFKDDEPFAQAVINMAAFLVEYRTYKRRSEPLSDAESTITGEQRKRWLKSTEQRDQELRDVLSRYQTARPDHCGLCGAPTEGRAMCPHCGNMTI